MPGYLLLLGLFLLLFSLCFYFAVREWLRPQDVDPLPVDVEYIRRENYFGESFRSKMREWLKTARPLALTESNGIPARAVLEKPNGEKILVLGSACRIDAGECQHVLYCDDDLYLPARAVFRSEIYALGSVQTGEDSTFRAVASDGDIDLGAGNEVVRWLDSRRRILLHRGTVVHSRVSARESIELEPGVSAESLYAPWIFTRAREPNREPASALPPVATVPSNIDALCSLDNIPTSRLGPETRMVNNDLELEPGSVVDRNLVVHGTLRCGPRCCFSASVKARRISLGPGARIAGNVVSEGAIEIGASSEIAGSVVAGDDIVLRSGVRIGSKDRESAVSAAGDVTIESDVAVAGKIVAGRAVVTV